MLRVLSGADACAFVFRRKTTDRSKDEIVSKIIDDVGKRGDEALLEYARRFDGLGDADPKVNPQEIEVAYKAVSQSFLSAVDHAETNIRQFAEWQKTRDWKKEIQPGVVVGQTVRPLQRVGCYVPGGIYPLPSTLLMTAIPAQVAGVSQIIVCSPKPAAETLATAGKLGLDTFYRIGGAQAIAAMALGTQSIPKVDKIVGPGNAYVAAAKRLLAGDVAIDSVAGPSEVVIAANEGDARWMAADLLAQAEHDADASAILITTNRVLAEQVVLQTEEQLRSLSTGEVAGKSLATNGAILVATSQDQALEWTNQLAPEHLCLHDPSAMASVQNAGSIFLGPYSTESLGDYASGPNHVLPTGGASRARAGLSVNDFLKVITFQEIQPEGLRSLSTTVTTLARAEGLEAHARAVEVRL